MSIATWRTCLGPYGLTLAPCLLRPKARGSVRLRSSKPDDQPVVDCNFFGDPDDLRLTIAGLRHARDILETEPLRSKVQVEILPGPDIQSDKALAE